MVPLEHCHEKYAFSLLHCIGRNVYHGMVAGGVVIVVVLRELMHFFVKICSKNDFHIPAPSAII